MGGSESKTMPESTPNQREQRDFQNVHNPQTSGIIRKTENLEPSGYSTTYQKNPSTTNFR